MKRILQKMLCVLAVLAGLSCLLSYAVYKGVYRYEMRFLPEAHTPASGHTIPDVFLNMAWHYFSGTGPRTMTPIRCDHWQ